MNAIQCDGCGEYAQRQHKGQPKGWGYLVHDGLSHDLCGGCSVQAYEALPSSREAKAEGQRKWAAGGPLTETPGFVIGVEEPVVPDDD